MLEANLFKLFSDSIRSYPAYEVLSYKSQRGIVFDLAKPMIRKNAIFRKPVLMVVICSILWHPALAQVGEINENVEKSKGTKEVRSNSTDSSSGGGGAVFDFIFSIFANTIGAAQNATLQNKHLYPERVSFILDTDFGPGFENNAWQFSTSARGNWGMFATDLRFNSLYDNTGTLNTLDWQVIVFKLPIQSFNLEYGLGFINLPGREQSYTSQAIGFDFKLKPHGIYLSSHYYWTSITSLDSRFRKAFEIIGDYEFIRNDHFHLSGLVKYSYQNYFDETTIQIVSAGLAMKIY